MVATPDDFETLLDVNDVAMRLKVRVRYVYRLVAERRIPFLKIGHHLRFRRSELEAWLDDSTVDASCPRRTSEGPRPQARRRRAIACPRHRDAVGGPPTMTGTGLWPAQQTTDPDFKRFARSALLNPHVRRPLSVLPQHQGEARPLPRSSHEWREIRGTEG
jgi:excisionase family DNA binding protein